MVKEKRKNALFHYIAKTIIDVVVGRRTRLIGIGH